MKYAKQLNLEFRKLYTELQATTLGTLSLRDEVSLYQAMLAKAIEKHQRIDGQLDEETDPKKRSGLLALRDVYQSEIFYIGNQVRDMTLAAAKLENDERTVMLGQVHAFVTAMCESVNQAFGQYSQYTDIDSKRLQQGIIEMARDRLADLDKLIDQKGIMEMSSMMPADMEASMMDAISAPSCVVLDSGVA